MPSPGSAELRLGPFSGHWYGLLVALGAVVFCVTTALVARRRGRGPWDVLWLCFAAVPCALIGARLYHLVTGGSGCAGRGGVRRRGWGTRDLRRCARRRARAVCRGPDPRARAGSHPRLRDTRAGARTGDRAARELVQPGAVRRADGPAVGARDRRRASSARACCRTAGSNRPSRSRPSGTSGSRSSSPGCFFVDARPGAASHSAYGSPGTVRDGSGSRGCGSSPRTTSARSA